MNIFIYRQRCSLHPSLLMCTVENSVGGGKFCFVFSPWICGVFHVDAMKAFSFSDRWCSAVAFPTSQVPPLAYRTCAQLPVVGGKQRDASRQRAGQVQEDLRVPEQARQSSRRDEPEPHALGRHGEGSRAGCTKKRKRHVIRVVKENMGAVIFLLSILLCCSVPSVAGKVSPG